MKLWCVSVVAVAGLCAHLLAMDQQQAPAPSRAPTGLIVGRVLDGVSGSPVDGAFVRVLRRAPAGVPGPGVQTEVVMTGADGRFLFRGLPKGAFNLNVQKAGYMPSFYGQRSYGSPGMQSIEIDDGGRVSDADIRIWKYATLTGRVVDEAGEPLVNTTVKACLRTVLAGRVKLDFAAPNGSAYTDDRGIFRHANLTPGEYVVLVASAGATVPASVQDSWDKAQREGASSELIREIDATSAVLPSLSGMRVGDFILGLGRTATGTLGVIRRPAPGELPPTRDGRLPVYRTTFYPGVTTLKETTVVTIKPGEEKTGVDFQMRPAASVRLSGTVTGPAGPQAHIGLRLLPAGYEEFTNDGGMMNYVTLTDARGAFSFLGVVPGQYTLKAIRRAPGGRPPAFTPLAGQLPPPPPIAEGETLWATIPVSIGGQDVDGVTVTLAYGLHVTGRVEFEGTAPRPPAERLIRIRLDLMPSDGRIAGVHGVLGQDTPLLGRVDANGAVTSYGLPSGQYVVTVDIIPEPWVLKSVVANGRDVSTSLLELTNSDVDNLVVTFTDRPSKLSGVVHDANGRIDATASVIVFPTDRSARADAGLDARRVKAVRVSRNASYSLIGLPAGDYFLVAVPDETANRWSEIGVLDALAAKATRQRIDDAAVVRVDLQTVRGKQP